MLSVPAFAAASDTALSYGDAFPSTSGGGSGVKFASLFGAPSAMPGPSGTLGVALTYTDSRDTGRPGITLRAAI